MQMPIEFNLGIFSRFNDKEIRSAQILHWVETKDSDELDDYLEVLLYNEIHKQQNKNKELLLWYLPAYVELLNRCDNKSEILRQDLDIAEQLRREFENAHDDDDEHRINW